MTEYNKKLQLSEVPKLLLYANPGGLIREQGVAWCQENLPNLTTVDIGEGLHFVQEDAPNLIGTEIAKWLQGLQ